MKVYLNKYFKTKSDVRNIIVFYGFFLGALFMGSYGIIGQNLKKLQIDESTFDLNVNTILEDSYGFLWFGTNNGLYRYDGHEMNVYQYDVFDKTSIPNNSINSIVEDENKNLWIGCGSSLVFYNRINNNFKGYYKPNRVVVLDNNSKSKFISVHLQDKSFVNITPHQNADSIHLDIYANDRLDKSFSSNSLETQRFFTDSFGRIWYGTNNGIMSLNNNFHESVTDFLEKTKVLTPYTNDSFLAAADNRLYIISYRKEDRKLQILEEYFNLPFTNINTICVGQNKNELWIGTNNGLFKGVRKNNKFYFEKIKNYSDNISKIEKYQINTLDIDSFGNLWVGTTKGVFTLRRRTSVFEHLPLLDHESTINNLFLDKEGNVWAGLSSGYLCKLNSNHKACLKPIDENKRISTIKYDHNNDEILVGFGKKLMLSQGFSLNSNSFSFKTLKTYENRINCILPINSKEIWVGLWEGGVDIINDNVPRTKFKKSLIKKLSGSLISAMHVDTNQTLWIGTRGRGLYKINIIEEKIKHFLPSKKTGLSSNAILCFLENQESNELYIGTRGGGLNIYNYKTQTFTAYGKNDGLPSSTIASMQFDSTYNIWLSTLHGLSRFDKKNKSFINFNSNDNVTENEFVYGSSINYENNEELLFGHSNGVYKVKTDFFKQNQQKANTAITKFTILGTQKNEERKEVLSNYNSSHNALLNTEITIPFDSNNIAIEFTSLDFTSPNKNKFAYMLEGVNNYWVYTTAHNRNATYNDLDFGSYKFMVKSSNSDGIWNDDPAIINFTINPPFWRSNIAYIIYVILCASLLYIMIILIRRWYRLKKTLVEEKISRQKEIELNKTKMVFFTDVSHELRTPLTLILGTMEKVINHEEHELSPKVVQNVYNSSQRMKKLIDQIMDIRKLDEHGFKINATKNNLIKDISAIKDSFNDFAKAHKINYVFINKKTNIRAWYDIDVLEKILYNILSNAFKNTPENGIVEVCVETIVLNKSTDLILELAHGEYAKCSVKDNGIGISEEDIKFVFDRYYQSYSKPVHNTSGSGVGMELVHKLIKKHHGKIIVKSQKNKFTEFTFWLPIEKRLYSEDEISLKNNFNKLSLITKDEFIPSIKLTEKIDEEVNNDRTKPKVLIVEDNVEQRKMLKEELFKDYFIIEAENGFEGYELAIKEQPQLIISDIIMPKEDGIELLKKIKTNSAISHIPVFMLTARDERKIKIQCIALGAEDYIEKPYSLEFVKWKVHNALLTRSLLKEKFSKVIAVNPSKLETDSSDEKFIRNLLSIVENSLDNSLLGVEFLAKEVGMSRASLYRKLQVIINDTPVNFIKQIRLKRACQLLERNNLYVSEIAYMTGFRERNYFAKCFNKAFGISPTQYAKQFKNNTDNNKSDVNWIEWSN